MIDNQSENTGPAGLLSAKSQGSPHASDIQGWVDVGASEPIARKLTADELTLGRVREQLRLLSSIN